MLRKGRMWEWIFFLGITSTLAEEFNFPFIPYFPPLEFAFARNVSEACELDLHIYRDGLQNGSYWAMQMYDATARGSGGILFGSSWNFGNFDECLLSTKPISAQYCIASIAASPPRNRSIENTFWQHVKSRLGMRKDVLKNAFCIPQSCSTIDLKETLQEQLNKFSNKSGVNYWVNVTEDLCTDSTRKSITVDEILFWSVCALFILANLLGTYIFHKGDSESSKMKLFYYFAIQQNVEVLVENSENQKHDDMYCLLKVLHGVKVVSLIGVIVGHRLLTPLHTPVFTFDQVEDLFKNPVVYFSMQLDSVVDTFFFASGLIATLSLLKTNSSFSYVITKRITSILPLYIMVIWFQASGAMRLGSGPIWKMAQGYETEMCRLYWWSNIIFVNNYIPSALTCLIYAWFIPCLIHYIILTWMLVFIIKRHPRFGYSLLIIGTLFSIVAPTCFIYYNKIKYIPGLGSLDIRNGVLSNVYRQSHHRISVYLLAVWLALLLHKMRNKKYELSLCQRLGIIFVGLIFCGGSTMVSSLMSWSPKIGLLLWSFLRRPLWGIGLVFFYSAHHFGQPNIMSHLLSCRVSVVLSRLTLSTYLIHWLCCFIPIARQRTPYVFNIYNFIIFAIQDILFSYFVSAVVHILFELPVKRIFHQLLFTEKKKRSTDM